MADSWGCEQDHFASSAFGGSQTLNELVESLTSRKTSSADGVQVVPCVIRKKLRFAPKILKKKSSINRIPKEPNVKRVTFEVEQLLTREGSAQNRSVARERLVMSLGGKPQKGRAVNYKLLKKERKQQKEEEAKNASEMKALLRFSSTKKKIK
ncbi:unnamed protein product [Heligmosomoides polygyrus]|uniref:40S ribosomal protein S6 n=1 Tax=Heligmosomoides polygyrus TaxID=6339 RepID=A0A183FUH8_HELPZ|nr:unnamed protein product [Heligmosomoides polygyrus]